MCRPTALSCSTSNPSTDAGPAAFQHFSVSAFASQFLLSAFPISAFPLRRCPLLSRAPNPVSHPFQTIGSWMLDVFCCILPAPFQLSAFQSFSVSPSRHRPGPGFSLSAFAPVGPLSAFCFPNFCFSLRPLSAFQFSAFQLFGVAPHDAHRSSSNLRLDPFLVLVNVQQFFHCA